ncbi:YisL family protein [Texcoconibacillus texcoconensis]|uniref:Putative membrane protein SirB2 n=1 Tax=Texcoconibacillus texcoconensis TaxID=1095777 RepID=A0A840QSN2_9BACI|nr:YisL family protein [Texcoconibacillus texcoconensis]MBB5174374.1 putative membrane protein SirB2 [Texcoconibacillus texcoconensis]
MNYAAILHSHALFWLLAVILFVVTVILIKKQKEKPAKIVQMTLRLMYVLTLATGGWLLLQYTTSNTILKGILAVWLIYVMEMITTRSKNGTLTGNLKSFYWIQFAIALIVVLYFGYVVT